MSKKNSVFSNAYIWLVLFIMYLPIVIVVIYSFNASRISGVWGGVSLKWYSELFRDADIISTLRNSLVLAGVTSVNSAVIGTLGAVGLSKLNFPGKSILDYTTTIPIMTPEIILGIAFLVFFTWISIPSGFFALVLAHTSFGVPYVYMLVKARLVGMDPSYAEAARDLGASEKRAFLDITLPAIAPSIFSGMLLAFAMSMDDVVISNFLVGPGFNTLPVKIYNQLKTAISPKYNALGTLMLIVTIIIVFIVVFIEKKTAVDKKISEGGL